MALNPEIRDSAYQFFIEEAPELLQIIEAGLLMLRFDRSTALVHELMRAAHSLKGGAASVELEAIALLAHRLENIFKALYSDTLEIDAELESQLLSAYDCLGLPLMEQIKAGYFDAERALAAAEPIFAQLEERLGDALILADSYIPSSAELGIDMTRLLFEVDVAQGLERLEQVVANPSDYAVAGELRAQAEVFAGFGELLNQPRFGAIAQTAIEALDAHPERAVEITQLALADFQHYRQAVLAGVVMSASANACSDATTALSGTAPLISPQELGPCAALIALADSTATEAPDFIEVKSQKSKVKREEDVFTSISPANSSPAPDTSPVLEFFDAPSETLDVELVADATFVTEEAAEELLSLEDVFGSAEATIGTEAEQELLFSELNLQPSNLQPSNLQPSNLPFGFSSGVQPSTPESLEEAVQSIEHIFESLAPIQDFPAPIAKRDATAYFTQSNSLARVEKVQGENLLSEMSVSALATAQDKSDALALKKSSPASPAPATSSVLSVRVDLDRLERMNNLVGELAINRNGLSLHNDQLQGSVRELLNRFTKVQAVVGDLRKLSDQMLVGESSSGSIALHPGFLSALGSRWSQELKVGKLKVEGLKENFQPSNLQPNLQPSTLPSNKAHFDSLELDSYGALHSRLQGMLEEMMQLEEAVDDIVLFAKATNQTLEQQRQMLTQLRDELMWARMLPLGEVLNRFPRLLRELSNSYQKHVNLKLSGTGVLVDKAVLEKLYDPLLHLLRNAFDHGIELPEIRRQRGKPEEGQIEIKAYHRGSQTIIEVRDDGQGLNTERIGRRAVELGLLSSEQLAAISNNQLFELLFEPGFSTAHHVSQLSGRGVGLDVVRSQICSLKGSISVTSSLGRGTTFTLRLPLTLSVAKLLVCFAGPTALAVPSDSIEEIIIPKAEQIKKSGTGRFLSWRGQIVPTYRLTDFLDYACPLPETSPSKALIAVPSPKHWALPMLILKQGHQVFALEVDRLVTEQELVIKPFGAAIAPPSCTYGCTILGDGSLIPVIDAAVLLEQLLEESTQENSSTSRSGFTNTLRFPSEISMNPPLLRTGVGSHFTGTNGISGTTDKTKPIPTVLVVDDAVALRRTLALTLERAGYRVLQARDGQEALERLQQTSTVNLVICDIEMPNMNGFEFLSQRRQAPELLNIPVVMLTSRSNDKHQWLAMQLGATGYFTKPYLEREFVEAIANILEQTKQ
jgi:chemotaxis family two-component system sensor histidine kinase/response regulator PixL